MNFMIFVLFMQAPDCDFTDLETIDDACVVETVKSVVKAWTVGG